MLLSGEGESTVNLGFGAGFNDENLHSPRVCCLLHVSDLGLETWIVWVHEKGNPCSLRNQLGKQLESFRHHLENHNADASQVTARPGKTVDQTGRDQVNASDED